MATSPAPDAAAPPGMCPGIAVLGGGGGGGDGDGDGSGGKDGAGGSGSGSGGSGSGDGKAAQGAPDYAKYPECGYASHPVDVVTGRAFTHPITDLELPGPLPLRFQRMYSSKMAERDVGLGYGWGHTFGWEIEVGRRHLRVWNEQGIAVDFPLIPAGGEVIGPWGWLLRRDGEGFRLHVDDGVWRLFSAADEQGKRYRLAAVEDRNRNRIALVYDKDRLVEIIDSAGRVIRVPSTKEGRIAALVVKNAVAQGQGVSFATYTYDDRGNLAAVRDADGFTARYEYDDEHRLRADTDRVGLTFHFVYDQEGRCVESWGDYPGKRDPSLIDGLPAMLADHETRTKGISHCRFDYMPGYYTEVADSTNVRRFLGTKHGTLAKSVDGNSVMEAVYRDDGHLMARTDPDDATTIYERDARGRVTKISNPLGHVTSFERGPDGLATKITSPKGAVATITRDSRGNPILVTDAEGGVSSYRYDDRGLLIEAMSASGVRTAYAYDSPGNVVSITQANGGVWRFSWDALGRRQARVDPLGAETRFWYSNRGDLIAVRDALGGRSSYTYDGERHVTKLVDPNGATTEFVWGGYHKLCGRKDANGNEVRLRYDLDGTLKEVHNEHGEVHRLKHDAGGRLIEAVTFDGRTIRYRNDAMGRVIRIKDNQRDITELTYDLAGQLIARELPDGSKEEYAWDEEGELVRAKSPVGEFRFERDAVGRIVREVQIVGGVEHWVEIGYNPDGTVLRRATSLGDSEVVTRGALGERTRSVLDGHVVEHRSDVLGRETGRALAQGGWMQSEFDLVGRLSRRRAGGREAARSATAHEPWGEPSLDVVDTLYRYDADGNLFESHDKRRGRTSHTHDPVGHLLSLVPEVARAEVFRYDRAGNVHESGPGAEERTYGPGNQLLRRGNTEYTWDDSGRLVVKRTRDQATGTDETWKYQWDAAGLMRSAEGPDGTLVEFAYDPFARRVEKRVTRRGVGPERTPVSVTRFVWDGDVLVHEVREAARAGGDPVVEEKTYCFEDGSFAPVAHREKRLDDVGREVGGWFHYVNDPIGTPERLVGEDGRVACELERTAWGKTRELPGATASTAIRFQGQYEDDETGLCYNRWRYYDEEAGRFVSPDPIGLQGGLNDQSYVPNPFRCIDPLGEAGGITKPPKGLGSVPKDKRDKKRVWTRGEIDDKITEQGGKCVECDKPLKVEDAKGHHITRHADGGPTTSDNLAALCDDCHKDIHR